MARRAKTVPASKFNYSAFHNDLSKKCKEYGTTLQHLSEKKLFRNENYLSSRLNDNALQLDIIIALCDMFKLNVRTYEVKEAPAPQPIKVEAKPEIPTICDSRPLVFNIILGGNTYTCETKVFSDLGVVASTLTHDGKVVATGRGNYHNDSVDSILRSVSYGIYALGNSLKCEGR